MAVLTSQLLPGEEYHRSEEAFRRFGGIPEEILIDNTRQSQVARSGDAGVVFTGSFRAFAAYGRFRLRVLEGHRHELLG